MGAMSLRDWHAGLRNLALSDGARGRDSACDARRIPAEWASRDILLRNVHPHFVRLKPVSVHPRAGVDMRDRS